VPANEIVNLMPGELFVHRNIANVVVHTDLNCLSVMQFAVDVLKVKHIIVCGHYGCSGVRAALRCDRIGLADNWLRHLQDVSEKHRDCVHAVHGEQHRTNRLCELNVLEQVSNVCQTTIARDAWARGQALTIHSWIYGLKDGLLRNLGMSVSRVEELEPQYRAALAAIESGEPFSAPV
jgi:carbonic anhydrase